MIDSVEPGNKDQDALVDRLSAKLGNLFTENELEKNLDIIVKMGVGNDVPLSFLLEHAEVAIISQDLEILTKAVEKCDNIILDTQKNNVRVSLPQKRNKIFIMNIVNDQVKEFEDYILNWGEMSKIKYKEYLLRENNYKLIFIDNNSASAFLDWLRANPEQQYEAKIYSETVKDAIRDRYKHRINKMEAIQQQNFFNTNMNMGMAMGMSGMQSLGLNQGLQGFDQQQQYMMNMMMMNMMQNNNQEQGDFGGNNPMANMGMNQMAGVNGMFGGMDMSQMNQMQSMLGNMDLGNMEAAIGGMNQGQNNHHSNNYKQGYNNDQGNKKGGHYNNNNYHNNRNNMFVRKAKGDGNEGQQGVHGQQTQQGQYNSHQ